MNSSSSSKAHLVLLPSPSGNLPTGKSRGLVVNMECNNSLASHHERSVKRIRTEGPNPPHRKDPPSPSSPNGGCGTPTTPAIVPHPPNPDTPSDVDQEMEEQTRTSTSNPAWGDVVENALPLPQTPNNGELHTQTERLVALHKTLENAMATLNTLSIHAVLPDRTLSLVQELYRRTKAKPSDEQTPSDDILSAIRKLAKDVEDLKRTAPHPKPSQAPKYLCHRPCHPTQSKGTQTGATPITTQQPMATTPSRPPRSTDPPHSRSQRLSNGYEGGRGHQRSLSTTHRS